VYFRALANLQVSVTAVFAAASIHTKHAKSLKGWRKNVEASEHLRGFCFGGCVVVWGRSDQGSARKFGFD
jgi:hypothetical protein